MTGNLEALSEREKETLRLLLEGHDAKSIARYLGLSVHTVNERLRASRRKLGVSSSREAARLLASAQLSTPNSVVNKQIGVADDFVDVNKDRRRNGRKDAKHPVVLAIGGTLIMSLIIATAILTWVSSQDSRPGPLPNWSTATVAPERGTTKPSNSIRLDGGRLLWNGEEATEPMILIFLDATTQINEQPLIIFSYSAQTSSKRVQRARLMIDKAIECAPSDCLEITLAGR